MEKRLCDRCERPHKNPGIFCSHCLSLLAIKVRVRKNREFGYWYGTCDGCVTQTKKLGTVTMAASQKEAIRRVLEHSEKCLSFQLIRGKMTKAFIYSGRVRP